MLLENWTNLQLCILIQKFFCSSNPNVNGCVSQSIIPYLSHCEGKSHSSTQICQEYGSVVKSLEIIFDAQLNTYIHSGRVIVSFFLWPFKPLTVAWCGEAQADCLRTILSFLCSYSPCTTVLAELCDKREWVADPSKIFHTWLQLSWGRLTYKASSTKNPHTVKCISIACCWRG